MRSLEAKKLKLQSRVKKIVNVHNTKQVTLIDLKAQTNSEALIALIEACKQHHQLEKCKAYVDQFENDPYFEIPEYF